MLEHEPRHADEAVDVRREHRLLVGLGRLVDRDASERQPGRVDEDVAAPRLLDEARAGLGVGDVERKRDVGLETLDAPSPADDPRSLARECDRGRRADPARRAGDDGGGAVENSHAA
jgi:hypothetical protein